MVALLRFGWYRTDMGGNSLKGFFFAILYSRISRRKKFILRNPCNPRTMNKVNLVHGKIYRMDDPGCMTRP